MTRYRDTARTQLRDAIVDAARELTVANGWDSVRMAQVADRVGVSRQTVYNEFANKAGLAEALAQREVARFVADVRTNLFAHGDDVATGAHAAILHVLREAAGNPLIKAILTSSRDGTDPLLPFLTTRAEVVLTAATQVLTDWAAAYLPAVDETAFAFAAESVVRLVVSHIVLPTAPVETTALNLTTLALHLIAAASAAPSR